jgi:hypothetical protein
VILSTGGTGLTGRDVTVEAHRDVYEKEIEAFGTIFTIVSMQKIGTSAVQSRATGGVAGGKYLFALPGSPGACRDAWDEILKAQLDYRHRPCNFVEIKFKPVFYRLTGLWAGCLGNQSSEAVARRQALTDSCRSRVCNFLLSSFAADCAAAWPFPIIGKVIADLTG